MSRLSRTAVGLGLLIQAALYAPAASADDAPAEELAHFSLEQLSELEVTSVSKAAEPLRAAPASIYVITHDEILRSGATSIVEALRLAPNLQVSQYNGTYSSPARAGLPARRKRRISPTSC